MNIIWQNTETGDIKVTHIINEDIDSASYALLLKESNERLAGYEAVLFNAVLPETRLWREAWEIVNDVLGVNLQKAKIVFKDFIRKARQPKLDVLDIAYMRALEKGETAEMDAIATNKQVLRDLTGKPEITGAATVESLLAMWPAALLGELENVA